MSLSGAEVVPGVGGSQMRTDCVLSGELYISRDVKFQRLYISLMAEK